MLSPLYEIALGYNPLICILMLFLVLAWIVVVFSCILKNLVALVWTFLEFFVVTLVLAMLSPLFEIAMGYNQSIYIQMLFRVLAW